MVQIAPQEPPGRFGKESVMTSPTEMLSRDHALMERLMISIESMIASIANGASMDLRPLNRAALLMKKLGAEHHMSDEERLIFPRIETSGRHEDLLKTLRLQHDRGRAIIDRIIDTTQAGGVDTVGEMNEIVRLCMSFIVMYRSHAAIEETVLFPALYDFASSDEIMNIQAIMRGEEEGLMRDQRFRNMMDSLAAIEAVAGTSDISRFTPE
ncbi:hemerythrin domain-containing protein [Methanocella arvoryzae]|uniref:Predicted hemerythrin-like protein n=1 Tax=Methanocella arvoryzae (strain DSM 22066 / NBRC 105507 / MRE50) TaxID=351160 RepID=Q0W2I7_METAR|nr:hemerythrin domain-containing protein [Methanocella arvoryzae]CAJ37406.1 predicted hemerythrin-like protein [Methanocella arvoryzae MRE50]